LAVSRKYQYKKFTEFIYLVGSIMGKNFEHMGTGETFLNRTPTAYALRSRIDKWDLIVRQGALSIGQQNGKRSFPTLQPIKG
jgi:hypothetical protein